MTESNEQQDNDMDSGLSVAERDILHRELRALPDTMPPRVVWQRIEQQARAEGLISGSRQFEWMRPENMKWVAGAAIAATVAMLVLDFPLLRTPIVDGENISTKVPTVVPNNMPRDLNALKVESQILERNLRLLPQQPSVMKVSTATTIQDLEDRIAAIDYRLNDRSTRLDAGQEEVYWRERVRRMKSLVRLRYAQAQQIAF